MDFGHLLVERGLISAAELEEALAVQRRYILEGREPVPRLGEILIGKGKLSQSQVAEVLAAQNKRILRCVACEVQVNVDHRDDATGYKCATCGGTLQEPPEGSDVRVIDTSVILVAREPVPPEVQAAASDPARKLGKYILLEEIGRGGWAIVHRAWDSYLHQFVALKFLKPPSRPAEADGRPRHETRRVHDLLREARSAIRLRHPHIVTVYDVGRLDKQFYIAMDCLQGQTLAAALRDARAAGKTSPFYADPRGFLANLRDLARAAHYAHTRQVPVIHCDIKPSNIFLDRSGKAYLLDFGLAREIQADAAKREERAVRGTPAYMSPEQVQGFTDQLDARTDVYGLGAVLYELLTGRPPFTGELIELLAAPSSFRPPLPSVVVKGTGLQIPPAIEKICMRCLEPVAAQRYASARELADEIDRWLSGADRKRATTRRTPGRPDPSVPLEAPEPAPSRPAFPAAVAAVGLSAAALVVALVSSSRPPAPQAPEEWRRTLDEKISKLHVDGAAAGVREAAGVGDPSRRDWLDRQAEGIEWVAALKGRLVEAVNSKPRFRTPVFRLRSGALPGVEIVHADSSRLVAITTSGTRDVPWGEVDPSQITDLVKQLVTPAAPADRMGLAVYCLRTGQVPAARELLDSLVGSDLEIPARAYRGELPSR